MSFEKIDNLVGGAFVPSVAGEVDMSGVERSLHLPVFRSELVSEGSDLIALALGFVALSVGFVALRCGLLGFLLSLLGTGLRLRFADSGERLGLRGSHGLPGADGGAENQARGNRGSSGKGGFVFAGKFL